MRRGVNRKLEMAARVSAFSRAHPSPDPEYATVLGRIEERLARAEAIAGKQFEGLAAAKSARVRRREIRKLIHFQLLRYLVAVGGVAAKTRSELAERFKLPDLHANNRVFLTAVKSMLELAQAQKDALVAEGMSPRLLEDLERKVAEFEAVIEQQRMARLDHIGARIEMDSLLAELMEAVRLLDGMNRWRFGSDPGLLAEWNREKRLPGDGTAPPTGGVAPAA